MWICYNLFISYKHKGCGLKMFSDAWNDILKQVNQFQESSGGSPVWFRGQNDSKYKLHSGLYRLSDEHKSNKLDYVATELAYYHFFKRMGYIHHKTEDWDLLFLMQHHGVKTRLLDWSESFAVALYFANEGWESSESCSIWMVKPLKLNYETNGEEKYYMPEYSYEETVNIEEPKLYENSLALYPMRNSPRIVSQHGMFTLQGKSGLSLDEEYADRPDILKKIDISPSLKKDVKKFLKISGVSQFTLFPDLDGLAKFVNSQGLYRPRKNQHGTKVAQ